MFKRSIFKGLLIALLPASFAWATDQVRQNMVQPLTSRAASHVVERLAAPAERALQAEENKLIACHANQDLARATPEAASQQQKQAMLQVLQAMANPEKKAA